MLSEHSVHLISLSNADWQMTCAKSGRQKPSESIIKYISFFICVKEGSDKCNYAFFLSGENRRSDHHPV